jgi:hypothetical protein
MRFLVVPGLDELVVDHVAKGVDDAHACEHALLPVDAHAHHLAIERNQLGDAAVTSRWNKKVRKARQVASMHGAEEGKQGVPLVVLDGRRHRLQGRLALFLGAALGALFISGLLLLFGQRFLFFNVFLKKITSRLNQGLNEEIITGCLGLLFGAIERRGEELVPVAPSNLRRLEPQT